MKTIILAGGKGTRLPVSAGDKPKSLVDVAGKTILERQIEWLLKHNLSDVRLALGFRAEQIINHVKNAPFYKNINIDYIIESSPLGTGGAIKFAAQGLKDDFLVLNGDILADADLGDFVKYYQNIKLTENCSPPLKKQTTHPVPFQKLTLEQDKGSRQASLRRKSETTITNNRAWCGVPRGTFLGGIITWKCPNCRDFGLIQIEKQQKNHKITAFLEKQDKIKEGYINAGVYVLSPKAFDFIKKDVFSIEKDLFPALAGQNKLFACIHDGYWSDLGTEERLEEARKKFVGM